MASVRFRDFAAILSLLAAAVGTSRSAQGGVTILATTPRGDVASIIAQSVAGSDPSQFNYNLLYASFGDAGTVDASNVVDGSNSLDVTTSGSVVSHLDALSLGELDINASNALSLIGTVPDEDSAVSDFSVIFLLYVDGAYTLSGTYTATNPDVDGGNFTIQRLKVDPSDPNDYTVKALTAAGTYSENLQTGYYALGFDAKLDLSSTVTSSRSSVSVNIAPTVTAAVPLPASVMGASMLFLPMALRRRARN